MQPIIRLFVEQDMTEGEAFSFAGGNVVVYSSRCPGKGTANEDAAILIQTDDDRGVLAVADGAGGLPGGEHAARVALDTLAHAVGEKNGRPESSLRTMILDGFERANQAVLELGIGAATTLAAVEVDGSNVRSYHVGDSEAFVTGQRGKIKLRTIPHTPVAYATEAGFLDEEEAMRHEDRHLVSNMVGMPDMKIEIGPSITLGTRDTLLIASDGVSDNLTTEEIINRTRVGQMEKTARQLIDDCLTRMLEPQDGLPCKPDDTTFILYRRN